MLSDLKAHHREIARLSFEGYTPSEIAEKMNAHVVTIRNILRDPICRAHIDALADKADKETVDVRKRLSELNQYALSVLEDMLRNDGVPHNTQLKAAQDVLDRNGYNIRYKHEHAHVHMTPEELSELKQRAKNAGAVWADDPKEPARSSPNKAFQLDSSSTDCS
jgi:IS30 family transposase